MWRTAFFLFAAFILAAPGPYSQVFAGDSQVGKKDEDLFSLSLEDLLKLEITASTRKEESLQTAPSSVTVFTGEEIRRMGISSVEALMNYVPGFSSARVGEGGNTYAPTARGRRVGISGREILFLIDGMRINEDYAGGAIFHSPGIPLENVERVEFIRGPGSALYGSNAFLGVVNIVTTNHLKEFEASYGSHYAFRAHAGYSFGSEDKGASLFFKFYKDEGQTYPNIWDTINGGLTETDDPIESRDVYVKAWYKKINVLFRHTGADAGDFYVEDRLSSNHDFNARRNTYSNQAGFEFKHGWDRKNSSDFKIEYKWSEADQQFQVSHEGQYLAVSNPPSSSPLWARAVIEQREWVLQWDHDYRFGRGDSLQAGIEYRRPHTHAGSWSNYDVSALVAGQFPIEYYGDGVFRKYSDIIAPSHRDIIGIYGQCQLKPWDPLTLTVGLRWDDYSGSKSSANPRAGLVYRVREDTSLKLLYGEAFRAPNRNERDANAPLVIEGNPDLLPEKSKTFEAIWIQRLPKTVSTLTYFHTTLEGIIYQTAAPDNPGSNIRVNGPDDASQGIEFELVVTPVDALRLRGTYTHFLELPTPGIRHPANTASLIVDYEIDRWKFNINGYFHNRTGFEIGEVGDETIRRLGGYTVFNTKVSYRFTPVLSLFGEIGNFLDRNYWTPPESRINPVGIPNRGRACTVGIDWKL